MIAPVIGYGVILCLLATERLLLTQVFARGRGLARRIVAAAAAASLLTALRLVLSRLG